MVNAQHDTRTRTLAARTALRPWLESLEALAHWFSSEARLIWAVEPERHARERITLLQATLGAMARGDEAIARPMSSPAAAFEPGRIDMLAAHAQPRPRRRRRTSGSSETDRRRAAVFDLALWNALRHLGAGEPPDSPAPTLGSLAAALAAPAPPAPGISPAPAYAASTEARRFFGETLTGVVAALASKKAGADMGAFAATVPAQPFDGGLPAIVAWSQAWSAAVAGVYLDNLRRHCGDDLQQALRDIWSGRLSAVRFRTGPGLTALPARDGALHLDLWTCAVKAQALAFDPAVWAAQAAGTQWHGVRVDMHELSRRKSALASAPSSARAAVGLGVELLYRTVFVDRLHEALSRVRVTLTAAQAPLAAGAATEPRTITVDLERPGSGQLPNLRLLLRWRDPPGGALRSGRAAALPEGAAPVRGLSAARIGWRGAPASGHAPWPLADGTAALGDAAVWDCIGPDVQWLDAVLVACVDARWYELPLVLEELPTPVEESPRTAWSLAAGAALPGSLDAPTLRRAAREGAMRWSVHERGLGAFVMAVVDVDAWRLARPD